MKDKKFIVTGGPTREWIDPVRFISNPSTGKMGIALADEAHNRGYEVVFVHGPVARQIIEGKNYRCISVESTADMLESVLSELSDNSVLVMAAAPSDYTPVEKSAEKIKKSGDEILLKLKKTADILKSVSELVREKKLANVFLAGFAAETTNTESYAIGKLKDKKLDMICLNDVSMKGAGFASDTNIITVFLKDGSRIDIPEMTKEKAADKIISIIEGITGG